jgi:hypothetical protein
VVPYHPKNPHFQYQINKIWQKNENHLKNMISRPIVALKRPPNLRDILTKARFGPPAIPVQHNPTQHLIRRRITSYDKQQLTAPIRHCLFTCGTHDEMHDTSNSLTEAIESDEFLTFCYQHSTCGKINIIPIQAEFKILVKCTECTFKQQILSTKRVRRIECEIFNAVDTNRKALLREKPIHKLCSPKCKICTHLLPASTVTDERGTNYRLLPFNCKARNAIYVIVCTLCDKYYVGMTSTMLKQRISNHLSAIRNAKQTSTAKHFNSGAHDTHTHPLESGRPRLQYQYP